MTPKVRNFLTLLGYSTTLSTAMVSAAIAEDATSQAIVASSDKEIDISANSFDYSSNKDVVKANGDVRVISENGSIFASQLVYNNKNGKITAKGDVVYTNKNNITIFTDEIEIEDELKLAVAKNLELRLGTPDVWGPTMTATSLVAQGSGKIKLKDTTFTACKPCEDDLGAEPLWKIRASEINYNNKKGQATYKNAKLDIKGVPVFYFPYFRHAVRDIGLTGLLSPNFGTSTTRGTEYEQGLHLNLSDTQDATIYAKTMSKKGTMLRGEYRLRTDHIFSNTKASYIYDTEENRNRSHLNTNTEYVFREGLRAGLVSTTASDDLYMDEFFDTKSPYLTSELYLEDASETHYYGLSASYFQDITEGNLSAETVAATPRLTLEKTFNLGSTASFVTLNADAVNLHRKDGTKSQRLTTSFEFSDSTITAAGNRFTLGTNLRTDVYNIDTDNTSTGVTEGSEIRFLPQLSATWERPFISPSGNHKITPKAMFIAAPNTSSSNLPNEDSVAYELDYTNLFSTNRFSGYDRQEDGTRIVYGVDNHWGDAATANWRLFFGQSLRLSDDDDTLADSGTETNASDWVGYVSGMPTEQLEFSSYFRVDNSEFTMRRMDNEIDFFFGENNKNYIQLSHTLLDNGPEEFGLKAHYAFTDTLAFEANYRKDLKNDERTLLAEGTLIYNAECAEISFTASRSGYQNRTLPPSNSYMFNIDLLSLGAKK